MPDVLCTPHLGASTEEAQTNVAVEAAELLIDFFTTGAIRQAVNMSPLDPKTLEGMRGYLNVAYRLGLLLAQVDHCPPSSLPAAATGAKWPRRTPGCSRPPSPPACWSTPWNEREHRQRRGAARANAASSWSRNAAATSATSAR